MRKTRVLIASLLKPVNDTRMFEKVGLSLAKLPETEIHIAGFKAKNLSNASNIYFHPIFSFKRLSLGRISAQWNYYKLLLHLKPEVIIPNTFELLPVTLLYRIFNRAIILYDVRENYYANIRFQPTFPKPIRWLLANLVRLIETVASPFILHFFLAEKSYAKELPFLKSRFTILENKFKPIHQKLESGSSRAQITSTDINLLYSGTITEIYGIEEAILLTEKLHALNPAVSLTIIGYCPVADYYDKVQKLIAGKAYIQLIGGKELVPHPQIVEAIKKANVGLLPYRLNKSTENCVPTKLYEYLANGLTVLIPDNPVWKQIVEEKKAGFSISFANPNAENILNRLLADTFYSGGIPADVFWENEEAKLLTYFSQNILKR